MRDLIEKIKVAATKSDVQEIFSLTQELETRLSKIDKYVKPLIASAEERDREQAEELEAIKKELGEDFDEDYDYLGSEYGGEVGHQIEAGIREGCEYAAVYIKGLLEGNA